MAESGSALVHKVEDAKKSRPLYTYKLPPNVANGIQSIGLIKLTANEERMAAKRSGGDTVRLVYEQAMQSLVQVNGQPVSIADGSADKAMNAMDPQVRNMVMTAFSKLHAPPEDALESFLASQTVEVS